MIDNINTYLNFSVKFSLRDNRDVATFPKASWNYSTAGTRAASAGPGLLFLWLMESFQNTRQRQNNEVNLSMKLITLKCRCNANSLKCQFLTDYSQNAFMLAYFKAAQGRNYI